MADLRARRALDGLLVRVRGDLLDAVHPAEPRRARHRAARVRVRVPHRPRGAPAGRALAETLFGLASLLTPFFMGTVVGAIAGGRVPVGNAAGDAVTSWLNPLSLVIGALFVATGAYLAAVFLVSDARRAGAPDLERYFSDPRDRRRRRRPGRSRPPASSLLHRDARYVFDGLTRRRAAARDPLARSAGSRCSCCSAAAPGAARARSRSGAVAAVIWGWGVAQHPYLLPQTLTISDAAAPSATLTERADRLRRRRRRSCCRRSGCCSRSSSATSSRRPPSPRRRAPSRRGPPQRAAQISRVRTSGNAPAVHQHRWHGSPRPDRRRRPRLSSAARELLRARGYVVVADAHDRRSAIAAVRLLKPDAVLLDVCLGPDDGFDVARGGRRASGRARPSC